MLSASMPPGLSSRPAQSVAGSSGGLPTWPFGELTTWPSGEPTTGRPAEPAGGGPAEPAGGGPAEPAGGGPAEPAAGRANGADDSAADREIAGASPFAAPSSPASVVSAIRR